MKLIDTETVAFPEIKKITYTHFTDERGYFTETCRTSQLAQEAQLINFSIEQINESSSREGVFRGLHFQWQAPMSKLVRVLNGSLIDFFLDIRQGSPTYGKIAAYSLTAPENRHQSRQMSWLWIPFGFAHGFLATSDCVIEYLCDAVWNPDAEACLNISDPQLDWSLCDPKLKQVYELYLQKGLLQSPKDKQAMHLHEWKNDANGELIKYKH